MYCDACGNGFFFFIAHRLLLVLVLDVEMMGGAIDARMQLKLLQLIRVHPIRHELC